MKERDEKTVLRLSIQVRVQHFLLMLSVTMLILTGLALMYSDSWLGKLMIFLEGGFETRGFLHRISAILLFLGVIYHWLYISLTREGHEEFLQILLRLQDFRDLGHAVLYDVGLRSQPPQFGRYGYREKFQYWAMGILILLMLFSGIILWYHNFFLGVLPKWAMDLTLVVHGSAGTILFLFLVLWHFYMVHWAPGKFPFSMTFWHGKITQEEWEREHPLECMQKKNENQ